MRTLTIILVVLFALTLNINGEEQKLDRNDPITTVVIISARHGEDYKVVGSTYGQYKAIKTAAKKVRSLKKNKHKYGIKYYNALFSTVMSGLEAQGIKVTKQDG